MPDLAERVEERLEFTVALDGSLVLLAVISRQGTIWTDVGAVVAVLGGYTLLATYTLQAIEHR